MRASWWWIDRWRKSTAYTDMELEEQGAYRNLLDELWLRDGVLPNNEKALAKICGDATRWPKVRDAVMARFYLTDKGWRNETHDEVMANTLVHMESQRAKGKKRVAQAIRGTNGRFQPHGTGDGTVTVTVENDDTTPILGDEGENVQPSQPGTSRTSSRSTSRATSLPSPSPSPSLSPDPSPSPSPNFYPPSLPLFLSADAEKMIKKLGERDLKFTVLDYEEACSWLEDWNKTNPDKIKRPTLSFMVNWAKSNLKGGSPNRGKSKKNSKPRSGTLPKRSEQPSPEDLFAQFD